MGGRSLEGTEHTSRVDDRPVGVSPPDRAAVLSTDRSVRFKSESLVTILYDSIRTDECRGAPRIFGGLEQMVFDLSLSASRCVVNVSGYSEAQGLLRPRSPDRSDMAGPGLVPPLKEWCPKPVPLPVSNFLYNQIGNLKTSLTFALWTFWKRNGYPCMAQT